MYRVYFFFNIDIEISIFFQYRYRLFFQYRYRFFLQNRYRLFFSSISTSPTTNRCLSDKIKQVCVFDIHIYLPLNFDIIIIGPKDSSIAICISSSTFVNTVGWKNQPFMFGTRFPP